MDGNRLDIEADGGFDPEELYDINATIGKAIRKCRRAKGMSQTNLGEIVGLTFQQVQKYEHGTSRISVARLVQFARIFGVAPEYMLKDLHRSDNSAPQALVLEKDEEPYREIAHLVSGMRSETIKMALSILRLIAANG